MQLVADANVILSAVIGGRAALVLRHEQVEQVLTPTAAYDEVFEYLAPLAKKKRLQLDTLLLTLAAIVVHHEQAARGKRKDHDAARRSDSEDFSRMVPDRDVTIGRHECAIRDNLVVEVLLDDAGDLRKQDASVSASARG